MLNDSDVIIIGGGLAGLTSAIHLSKSGVKVTLIEKNTYPKHKVCGEYVSNEVLPYLQSLGADMKSLTPQEITNFLFSSSKGKIATTTLPTGGFGVSRYALDKLLYDVAVKNGCNIIQSSVVEVNFQNDIFSVKTEKKDVHTAKVTIGAFGKRSNLDHQLSRKFIQKKSAWLGVKCHYKGNFPDNLVGLYNFKGGYCGVSKVENNQINVCYLADYSSFKKYKDISHYQKEVLSKNKHLKNLLEQLQPVFEKPLTISQISFDKKKNVENHILMIGDTAGLIHPLCGNGMAMAIHGAQICSELIIRYLTNKEFSYTNLEQQYALTWNQTFKKRLRMGRFLASVFRNDYLTKWVMHAVTIFPPILPYLIQKTHGKPLKLYQHDS